MELETKCDIITLNTMKKIKVFFVVVVSVHYVCWSPIGVGGSP